jgi:predicted nucleic acid-binding protein
MILVDTSVWIDHFRASEPYLVQLIDDESALTHPFIIGEFALGSFKQRASVIEWFQDMTIAPKAEDQEVMEMIETHRLFGLGIGYVDAHLLACVRLTGGARLWTRDKRLSAAAQLMGISVVAETQH